MGLKLLKIKRYCDEEMIALKKKYSTTILETFGYFLAFNY